MEENKKKLQAFIPVQVSKRLDYLAEDMGITRAELAKRILTEWLESNYEVKSKFWEQPN